MQSGITRREAVGSLGAAAAGMFLRRPARGSVPAPTAPVAIGKCTSYQPSELLPVLEDMFDKLGGLGRLVKGKTVAIKLNFNGGSTVRLGYHPLDNAFRGVLPRGELERPGFHRLRPDCGIREYQLPGFGQETVPAHGAQR